MVTFNYIERMGQPEIRLKMPNWYYDKQALRTTPSFLNGISNEKEMRYRREGAWLIEKVGRKLGLKCETWASGIIYFHRFYMFHSFKQFPRFITSCCCLLLAGKVEETPKKCKQIIETAKMFLNEKRFQTFGDNPREEVMTLERILLKTIKFDLQISHPYQFLIKYAKAFYGDHDQKMNLVQMSWTFVNDSLKSTLCLQWEPEIIGIAAMYLSSKISKFKISDWEGRTSSQLHWWEAFASEVSVKLLEDICHQILDVYNPPTPDVLEDSPREGDEELPPSPADQLIEDPKKLAAPPLPSMSVAAPPPLPKEPPQFAPPPSEPPPMASSFPPPLPPLISPIGANSIQPQSRPVGSAPVPSSYPPHYYLPPVPPPQDYPAQMAQPPPHQFYGGNPARHIGSQGRPIPQPAAGAMRDHYRPSNQAHHPYMRGQGAPYMMPSQRR